MLKWRQSSAEKTPEAAASASGRAASPQSESLELALLQGVKSGQHRDFEALYRIYHPRLQRFLAHLTRRPELVDEVLDDTMMVVWQRAGSFDGRSRLSTWVFGIAYRRALKALGRLDLPQEDTDPDAHIDPGLNPEQQLGLAQMQARLRRAMEELSPEHRAVVELCYFHEMAYGEIALVVDCPPETVKTRMFYARRRLRVLLADVSDTSHGESS